MKRFMALMLLICTPAAYGEIYTWKDARGTAFYTNSLNEIPARYLPKARILDVATGKKGGLVTGQPVAPGGSAGAGQAAPQQASVPVSLPPAPAVAAPAFAPPAPAVATHALTSPAPAVQVPAATATQSPGQRPARKRDRPYRPREDD